MKTLLAPILLTLSLVLPAVAQDWALEGFDPVGYITQNRALPGRSDISTMWRGKVWHFVSEENRARFEANPRSYIPVFDGYCPVQLSKGRFEIGNPSYFAIRDRRIYLLRSRAALREFVQNPEPILSLARSTWQAR